MDKKDKQVKVFEYEGNRIAFDFGDDQTLINATEMAKIFNKRVGNFLKSKHAKDYILLLESRYSKWSNGNKYKAFRMIKGGTPELQGTWMDEKLALKFAAWLNPKFELWVYDKIYELMTTGQTSLHSPESQVTLDRKHLEWIFRKIQDNAIENYNLSNLLKDLEEENN